jgi:hypothetical protein
VAVKSERNFRFGPLKKHLLSQYGLASHWSCTHEGYHSCIAYGYEPTERKKLADLDKKPETWAAVGKHPPLHEAFRPPVTADASQARREHARRLMAERGKPGKFEDIDLWPIIIRENIMDTAAAPEVVMGYAKRCGGEMMVKFCFRNWDKLPQLIQRCWRVERVEEFIAKVDKPRLAILEEALDKACVCGGRWVPMALELLTANDIPAKDWCAAMLHSLENGRSKGNLVCHAGHEGNEGKSFMFEPLEEVFGEDMVFCTPPKGGFPFMGLERCRVSLLEDWRFNEDLISYPLQLLWFEGKPIVIARPQNQFSGHLKYCGDAPIFISTLMADIRKIKGKKIEGGDVEMMLKRLKIFEFFRVLKNPVKVPACGRCFATLVLNREGQKSHSHTSSARGAGLLAKRTASTEIELPEAKRSCSSWLVDDVIDYLGNLGLGHLQETFRDNGVDGPMLAELTPAEMQSELGLTLLQARKVQSRLPK